MSRRRHDFRPKLIALSVAACFSLSATHSQANPTGGSVASGSASFATSGNTLSITNSAGTVINWASFSIGVNETTQFLQSSSASAVLNRVVGANGVIPQSVIDGILSSNGRVFLLNQSGILIGSTARIDVAGFVASSLNLSDQDFLTGRLRFTETPGAGAVSNAGIIDSGAGGRVFLVAPDVQNSGIIRSPQGEIVLAAGKSVELVSEGSPFVTVNLTADSEQALNVGQLLSESGRAGMFGALVRQGGVIEANSAVAGANGEIRLVATRDLTLDAGSRTAANGPSGGKVLLQAQGGTNLISGTVEAKGASGQGGTIQALGVRVGVIGDGIIDASGDAGGGTVLVGGDRHGDNPAVQNAERTLIGPDGVIRADAGTSGDGGRVIVWADGDTRFYGAISAQGGSQSGNGGFVETSGELGLDVQGGRIDTRAANGRSGTWLLDPVDVTIIYGVANAPGTDPAVSGASPGVDTFAATPVNGGVITSGTLESNFQTVGTTRIQATNNVDFKSDLNLSSSLSGQVFEVRAQNNINLAADGVAHTIFTKGQDVVLSANDVGPTAYAPLLNTTSGTGSIIGGGNIFTDFGGSYAGNITLSGYGVNVGALETRGGLSVQGGLAGTISITALGGGIQAGSLSTRGFDGADFNAATRALAPTAGASGGDIVLFVTNGSVSTGNIDVSGGRGGNGGAYGGVVFAAAGGGSGANLLFYGAPASLATGAITATGGSGGNGANNDPAAYGISPSGGAGGNGGTVVFATSGLPSLGTINVSGGNGGNGGDAYGIGSAGSGGGGGAGGLVELFGNADVAVGNVFAKGGSGGSGGNGGSGLPAGLGGAGGGGGNVIVSAAYGSIDMIAGGLISTHGGDGGAGGNGDAILPGGAGGSGGVGGMVDILAPSGTVFVGGGLNVDGVAIPQGVVSISSMSVPNGGSGGAGGTGGGGAGASGLLGGPGLITVVGNFDLFQLPSSGPDIDPEIREMKRWTLARELPSADEIERKNEENKQKKGAVCK